jgi:hypothetical protein
MQQNILETWARQLLVQVPVLVALILMLVMALVFWGRYPRACLLAFLGSLLLLGTGLLHPLANMYVIETRSAGASTVSMGDKLLVVSLVMNTVRAAGYGLLIGAIFAGRTRPAVSGFPVSATPPPPYGGAGPGTR